MPKSVTDVPSTSVTLVYATNSEAQPVEDFSADSSADLFRLTSSVNDCPIVDYER